MAGLVSAMMLSAARVSASRAIYHGHLRGASANSICSWYEKDRSLRKLASLWIEEGRVTCSFCKWKGTLIQMQQRDNDVLRREQGTTWTIENPKAKWTFYSKVDKRSGFLDWVKTDQEIAS